MTINCFVAPGGQVIDRIAERVIPALAARAAVRVWSPDEGAGGELACGLPCRPFSPAAPPWAAINRAEVNVYFLGEHPTRSPLWGVSQAAAGVLVLSHAPREPFGLAALGLVLHSRAAFEDLAAQAPWPLCDLSGFVPALSGSETQDAAPAQDYATALVDFAFKVAQLRCQVGQRWLERRLSDELTPWSALGYRREDLQRMAEAIHFLSRGASRGAPGNEGASL